MARVSAILKALYRAFQRDWKSFGSLAANNFFPISAFFLRQAGIFVYLIAALVVLFPMSTDPLRKIPASRLEIWPLDQHERRLLRILSPWVNPMTWILAALAAWAGWGRMTLGLWGLIAALVAVGFVASEIRWPAGFGMFRRVPPFPGLLNQLVRKNLREILSALDFYCALLLSVSVLIYRVARLDLPQEALLAMTMLVLLALSSYTQCLFGLDGAGGRSRYRLLPLAGWQILAAKDAAFLLVAVVLAIPLMPLAALAAAMVLLAMGHAPTVNEPRPQMRWRFSTGVSIMYGVMQVLAMTMAGAGVVFTGLWVLGLCAAAWVGSLWWYGRELGKQDNARD